MTVAMSRGAGGRRLTPVHQARARRVVGAKLLVQGLQFGALGLMDAVFSGAAAAIDDTRQPAESAPSRAPTPGAGTPARWTIWMTWAMLPAPPPDRSRSPQCATSRGRSLDWNIWRVIPPAPTRSGAVTPGAHDDEVGLRGAGRVEERSVALALPPGTKRRTRPAVARLRAAAGRSAAIAASRPARPRRRHRAPAPARAGQQGQGVVHRASASPAAVPATRTRSPSDDSCAVSGTTSTGVPASNTLREARPQPTGASGFCMGAPPPRGRTSARRGRSRPADRPAPRAPAAACACSSPATRPRHRGPPGSGGRIHAPARPPSRVGERCRWNKGATYSRAGGPATRGQQAGGTGRGGLAVSGAGGRVQSSAHRFLPAGAVRLAWRRGAGDDWDTGRGLRTGVGVGNPPETATMLKLLVLAFVPRRRPRWPACCCPPSLIGGGLAWAWAPRPVSGPAARRGPLVGGVLVLASAQSRCCCSSRSAAAWCSGCWSVWRRCGCRCC